jgi:hypothetical protein
MSLLWIRLKVTSYFYLLTLCMFLPYSHSRYLGLGENNFTQIFHSQSY